MHSGWTAKWAECCQWSGSKLRKTHCLSDVNTKCCPTNADFACKLQPFPPGLLWILFQWEKNHTVALFCYQVRKGNGLKRRLFHMFPVLSVESSIFLSLNMCTQAKIEFVSHLQNHSMRLFWKKSRQSKCFSCQGGVFLFTSAGDATWLGDLLTFSCTLLFHKNLMVPQPEQQSLFEKDTKWHTEIQSNALNWQTQILDLNCATHWDNF